MADAIIELQEVSCIRLVILFAQNIVTVMWCVALFQESQALSLVQLCFLENSVRHFSFSCAAQTDIFGQYLLNWFKHNRSSWI